MPFAVRQTFRRAPIPFHDRPNHPAPPAGLAAALSPGVLRAADPVNLALHCEYVSSDPNVYGWEVPGLTDGVWGADATTCYATGKSAAFPKTVTVDLRAVRSVGSVVFGVPPFGSTRTVDVSLSVDGTHFSVAGSHTFEQGSAQRAVVTGAQTDARYVRLTYQDHYPDTLKMPGTFVFTSELEVYAGPAPAPPDPALAAVTPTVKDPDRHRVFLARIAEAPVGVLCAWATRSSTDGRATARPVGSGLPPTNPRTSAHRRGPDRPPALAS